MVSLPQMAQVISGWARIQAVATCAGAYLLTAAYLLLSLDSLVYYPAAALDATPDDFGLEAEDTVFRSTDGVDLHG